MQHFKKTFFTELFNLFCFEVLAIDTSMMLHLSRHKFKVQMALDVDMPLNPPQHTHMNSHEHTKV